jgi:hypothetical protein
VVLTLAPIKRKNRFQNVLFNKMQPAPLRKGASGEATQARGLGSERKGWGSTYDINRSTCQVKPLYLSSETVLPIKSNRSTYQVKPFYLSSQTVLPFKCNVYRYMGAEGWPP